MHPAKFYVHETLTASGITFTWAPWLLWLTVGGGALLLILGWRSPYRSLFALAGACVLLGLAPVFVQQYVTIDADHLVKKAGLWFEPTLCDIRFDSLSQLRLFSQFSIHDRNQYGMQFDYLTAVRKNGTMLTIPVEGIMANAVDAIIAAARARGVPVVDKRGVKIPQAIERLPGMAQ